MAAGAAETAATGGAMGPVTIVGGAVVAAGGWFGRGALAKVAGWGASRVAGAGATAAGSGTGAAAGASGAAASGGMAAGAGGAAANGGMAATAAAWLPVAMTAITVVGVGMAAYQGYQWWRTPDFPLGMQVDILAGPSAGARGRVVGIVAGDIAVDLGDGSQLLTTNPHDLAVVPAPPEEITLPSANPKIAASTSAVK